MQETLKELLKQKREINRKIKEYKQREYCFGKAKIGVRTWAGSNPDEWYVAIKVKNNNWRNGLDYKYFPIYNGSTKQEAVDSIPDICKDLQGLYQNMMADM